MPDRPFAYAMLRVVPSLDRGESFNAGVVLFCRQRDFLALRHAIDPVRLAALAGDGAPELAGELDAELAMRARVAAGDAAGGPIAALPQSERFGWLVAPASTVIQPSDVHTGLCENPAETLDRLFAELVNRPGGEIPPRSPAGSG